MSEGSYVQRKFMVFIITAAIFDMHKYVINIINNTWHYFFCEHYDNDEWETSNKDLEAIFYSTIICLLLLFFTNFQSNTGIIFYVKLPITIHLLVLRNFSLQFYSTPYFLLFTFVVTVSIEFWVFVLVLNVACHF